MQSAISIAELLDLETPLEAGVKAAFDAMDFSSYTRLNAWAEFQKRRPRVEVEAQIGSGNGHCYVSQINQPFEQEDQFSASIVFVLVTAPQNEPENNGLMPQFRSAVRAFASQLGQLSRTDTSDFPFHCFSDRLRSVGTEYNLQNDQGAEVNRMTYTGAWGIRTNAWAALGY